MNTKTKLMQLAMVGAFSSLFWAGCASDRAYENTAMEPINLFDTHANTYPAKRTGLDHYSHSTSLNDLPSPIIVEQAASPIIIEQAGAERP